MSAYATGDDLAIRYDIDLIRDLASDRDPVDRDAISDYPRVVAALEDASGEVEVALTAGGRYSAIQLSELAGNSGNHLKQIVCGLAMAALHRRRPESADRDFIESIARDAREAIRALRRGENVFGLQETIQASVVQISGPTAVDLHHKNALPERMGRFFPEPASRLPLGR